MIKNNLKVSVSIEKWLFTCTQELTWTDGNNEDYSKKGMYRYKNLHI